MTSDRIKKENIRGRINRIRKQLLEYEENIFPDSGILIKVLDTNEISVATNLESRSFGDWADFSDFGKGSL